MLRAEATTSPAIGAALLDRRLFRPLTAAIALGLLTLLCVTLHTDWGSGGGDDAYITYRYAENIARGDGFVFNPGGPAVLGTTTPLFTLILAAGARLGATIPTLSLTLGVIGWACAVGLIVLLASELGAFSAGVAIALTWALSPLTATAMSGMETSLYVALIVGALYAATRARLGIALTLAALATVTRPDGLALIVAVVASVVARRTWTWKTPLPGVAILLAWLAYATITFGSPLPNSGLAKMVHDPAISGSFTLLDPTALALVLPVVSIDPFATLAHIPLTASVGIPVSPWLLAIVVLFEGLLFGGAVAFRRIPKSRTVLLWLGLYTLGYSALHVPSFPWYYAPLSFVGGLIFWIGIEHLLLQIVRNRRVVALLSVSAAAILGLITLGFSQQPEAVQSSHAHEQAGAWLREHAQPGQTVVAYEVGTVAYLSDLTTIDILGLTEPRALTFVQRGDYGWAVRLAPDYILTVKEGSWPVIRAVYDEPSFQRDYRLVAQFPNAPAQDYLLYQRIAPA